MAKLKFQVLKYENKKTEFVERTCKLPKITSNK